MHKYQVVFRVKCTIYDSCGHAWLVPSRIYGCEQRIYFGIGLRAGILMYITDEYDIGSRGALDGEHGRMV